MQTTSSKHAMSDYGPALTTVEFATKYGNFSKCRDVDLHSAGDMNH